MNRRSLLLAAASGTAALGLSAIPALAGGHGRIGTFTGNAR